MYDSAFLKIDLVCNTKANPNPISCMIHVYGKPFHR